MSLFKDLGTLTKQGIVFFAVSTAVAGFAVSFPLGQTMEMWRPIALIIGIFLLSSGSFSLNQAQEWKLDKKMDRTKDRPVAAGRISPFQAAAFGILLIAFGSLILLLLNEATALLGLATVVMYNGLYTLWWKPNWSFGAVPGAIPGAMPVVIGYSANGLIFTPECAYLFLVMFLWQMPHFWSLAIRYMDDYKQGNIPVLPVTHGIPRTLYFIGLYTFCYVGVAVISTWFFRTHYFYTFLTLPLAFKILYEFVKYFRGEAKKSWLRFFLWTNMSVLVFIAAPAFERWAQYFYFISR